MTTDGDINTDNIIPVTMEDLAEEDRMEIERVMEEQKKMMLAGFQKTRNGVVNKVATPGAMPSNSTLLGTEVKQSNEEIAHLVDISVASKFGNDMTNAINMLSKSMADKIEEFEKRISKNLEISSPHHARLSGQHVKRNRLTEIKYMLS